MNILIFSTAYLPFVGGAELAIKEITDRLSPSEFSFDLITLNLGRKQKREEMVGNVRVVRLSCPKWWFPFLAFTTAARLHRAKPYGSVWSVMASYGGFAGLFFKYRFPRIPFILTLQEGDSFAHIYRRVFFVWPLFRMIFTRADRITAISTYLAEWAKRMGTRCPIEVIPNGVNIAKFQIRNPKPETNFKSQIQSEELRKKLGLRSGDKIVITTSRLVKKNGVGDLIEAMRYLPEEVKLLICGAGPLLKNLQLITNSLQLSDRVRFVGYISHDGLPHYLHAADVFCRPSLSEGMGSSFVEAMAAGLPVVATPIGGIPDFLSAPLPGSEEERYLFSNSRELANRWSEKITGLFVKMGDSEDIAGKIRMLLSNDILREHIIKNASKMVREKYDWDAIAKMMQEAFSLSRPIVL